MKTNDLYLYAGLGLLAVFLLLKRKPLISATTNILSTVNQREQLKPFFRVAEKNNNLPTGLLERMAEQESNFRPEIINGTIKSSAGAIGLMQIVPKWHPGVNPYNPIESINYAGKYIKNLFDTLGSWEKALAAYNWGIGNVQKLGLQAMPTETKNYVSEILQDVF